MPFSRSSSITTGQNEKNSSQRLTYIDALKGFAILCVVLGHIAIGYIDAGIYSNTAFLPMMRKIVYAFHMPLFFMISGFLFQKAYFGKHGTSQKIADSRRRTQTLNFLILYFVHGILMMLSKKLLSGFVNTQSSIEEILRLPVQPNDLNWYLYVLVELYLIFSLRPIREISEKILAPLLLIAALLTKHMSSIYSWFQLGPLLYYAPFFYIGMLLCQKKDIAPLQKAVIAAAGSVACVLCLCSCMQGWAFDEKPYAKLFVGMALSLLLFLLFANSHRIGNQRWLSFIGKHSLEIYLFHVYFTAGFRVVDRHLNFQNVYLSVFCNLVLSTGIPLCAGCVCKRLGLYTFFFQPMTFIRSVFAPKNDSGQDVSTQASK